MMKHFTLIALAALFAASPALAQTKASTRFTPPAKISIFGQSPRNGVAPSSPLLAKNARRVQNAPELITEQPEGKSILMAHAYSGLCLWPEWDYASDVSIEGSWTRLVEGTDGNVYLQNFIRGLKGWVKAEPGPDGTLVIKRQPIDVLEGTDGTTLTYYIEKRDLKAITVDGETRYDYVLSDEPLKFIYKDGILSATDDLKDAPAEDGIWDFSASASPEVLPAHALTVGRMIDDADDGWEWIFWNNEATPLTDTPVTEIPEGAKAVDYVFSYNNFDEIYHQKTSVYFVGNDFYFKVYDDAEGYIKGEIVGDKAIIKSGQFLGIDTGYDVCAWLMASEQVPEVIVDGDDMYTIFNGELRDQLELDYDAATQSMTTSELYQGLCINRSLRKHDASMEYIAPDFTVFTEVPAVPAAPSVYYEEYGDERFIYFTVYTKDVDGNYILPEKLSYSVYIDDEVLVIDREGYGVEQDVTELPYGFVNEYINTVEFPIFAVPVKNVGMQSIYRGGGKTNYSDIVIFDIATGETEQREAGIKGVTAQPVTAEVYHDVTGRKVGADAKGLVIKTVTFADGSRKSFKVRK